VHTLEVTQQSLAHKILHICGYVYDLYAHVKCNIIAITKKNSHGFDIRLTLIYTFRILENMGYTQTHSEFPCNWCCCNVCSRNKYDCHVE
jgi:1-aminocyclopropane-1-carboxylate deaminase/D-cysteine desulfhydrase-like pyridoxal-dependent ACC family enzyme